MSRHSARERVDDRTAGRERAGGDAPQRHAEVGEVDERRRRTEEPGAQRHVAARLVELRDHVLPRRVVRGAGGVATSTTLCAVIVSARCNSCTPNSCTRFPNASRYESCSDGGGSSCTTDSTTCCQLGRARHQARHRVAVGHRRAVLVGGPMLDLEAAHGARGHDVSDLGRAQHDRRHRRREPALDHTHAGLVDDGPRRRQQLAERQRKRSPRPLGAARARPASRSPTAWRSSRSIAETSERGLVSSWISSEIAASSSTSLRCRRRYATRLSLAASSTSTTAASTSALPIESAASAVHRRLDEVDHDERPFQPPTGVADPPCRPAHDALVPQPGEGGEVGEHGVEIVDARPMRVRARRAVRRGAPALGRSSPTGTRGRWSPRSAACRSRRATASVSRSSSDCRSPPGRDLSVSAPRCTARSTAPIRRSHSPPSSNAKPGILLDPRGDAHAPCGPSLRPAPPNGSSSTERRPRASATIGRSRPAAAAAR